MEFVEQPERWGGRQIDTADESSDWVVWSLRTNESERLTNEQFRARFVEYVPPNSA